MPSFSDQIMGDIGQPVDPALANLFSSANYNLQKSNNSKILRRGALMAFSYMMWRNDPYPLVIVTDYIVGERIRGINLHYLTFPYIRNLLKMNMGMGFSYQNIANDNYITNAFRTYKWPGVKNIKFLDTDFLMRVMGTVRSIDPMQIQTIRESVREQIAQEMNPPAEPTEE